MKGTMPAMKDVAQETGVIGIVPAGIGVSPVWNALGIGQIKPDCQLAYVGTDSLPEEGDGSAEGTYLLWGQCPAAHGHSVPVLPEAVHRRYGHDRR